MKDADRVRERLFLAFELYDFGESMMRQNLRRRHPEATEAEIEERLVRWLDGRDEDIAKAE